MKIGILTQPLLNNYGGLLQAFALQTTIKKMGHEVWTVDLKYKNDFLKEIKSIIIRTILKYIFRRNALTIFPAKPTTSEMRIISQNTNRFIEENIQLTDPIQGIKRINNLKKYQFKAYIIGSDQVWRPRYSPGISAFFLDFLGDEKETKRIAYAASFGVDHWEFNPILSKKCKKLAQKFDAISVREDTAVSLCKQYLGVSVTHLIDPTLLLKKEDYLFLIEKDKIPPKKNTLLLYVLDKSTHKMAIAEKISNHLKLDINTVMPEKQFSKNIRTKLEQCVYPSVNQWIRGFFDAEYVVTDSFHGTIFSIIFNKQFISIGNDGRGLARFNSLLRMFGLESRLILSLEELTLNKIEESIDFDEVNRILELEKQKAYTFIKKALN